MGMVIGYSALAVFCYFTLIFAVAQAIKDTGIVDIAWGPGFLIVSLIAMITAGSFGVRSIILTTIVGIWGLRLGVHILIRNIGRGEDFRYNQYRRKWKRFFGIIMYVRMYLLQGLFMLIISAPILFVHIYSVGDPSGVLRVTDFIGLGIWLAGFLFETVGDTQLLVFKRKPDSKGKIMMTGLWRYTRHPNYFGETVLWWGIFFFALFRVEGLLTFFGPATITFLLLKVSGGPMLEKKWAGDEVYEAYKKRTSYFVPLPPRRK